jgi:hypothetical protein
MRDIKNEVVFISEREFSSMSSTWLEQLVIVKGYEKKYRIANAAHDAIAEAYEYFNEDKDDYELPAEIDGQQVLGVSDGYIIGGELGIDMDNAGLDFDDPEEDEVKNWLVEHGWSTQVTPGEIRQKLE